MMLSAAVCFLSPDSIGEAGGPNLYAYVGNGPIGEVDPLGLYDQQTIDYIRATPGVIWADVSNGFNAAGGCGKIPETPSGYAGAMANPWERSRNQGDTANAAIYKAVMDRYLSQIHPIQVSQLPLPIDFNIGIMPGQAGIMTDIHGKWHPYLGPTIGLKGFYMHLHVMPGVTEISSGWSDLSLSGGYLFGGQCSASGGGLGLSWPGIGVGKVYILW